MKRLTLLLLLLSPNLIAQAQPTQGAFYTHRYRNLFAEDGHPQPAIDAKLQAAYAQLFHGDPQTQAIFFAGGSNSNGPLAYITDWNNHDVRSEGLSYGMMLSVQLNHRAEFNAIWNWTNTYLALPDPKHPSHGFFAWSAKTDGTLNSETPAPDGEEYFAMALLFASARWGDGVGLFNYHAQADTLLHNMLHRQRIAGLTKFGVRDEGNEFSPEYHMVRFIPDTFAGNFTDPSYHLPAFYELWARWGPPEDRPFWAAAAQTSRRFFLQTTDPHTALAPVYANWDGTPHPTRFPESGLFGQDAWRVASNWSVDWAWFHADPNEPILADRYQSFFTTQGPQYGSIFSIQGKNIDPNHSAGLAAANAVPGLAATDPTRSRPFTEELWNQPIPAGQYRYYDGMLYLLSFLHTSGNFRIYTPSWAQLHP